MMATATAAKPAAKKTAVKKTAVAKPAPKATEKKEPIFTRSFHVDPETWAKARVKAANEGVSLSLVLREAVDAFLEAAPRPKPVKAEDGEDLI